ncbi:MAG: chorismate lyase [Gammaproteobacteria bacterium]|nr:chorismate lyase [Gammaproteobacteria bacterium]
MALIEPQYEQTGNVEWRPMADAPNLFVDARLQDLVAVTGSLTRRLRDLCGDAFNLRLLGERRREESPALIREVLMSCGDLPWVFAQTVIPQATLIKNPWLSQLGNRPLGDTLFERPNVTRSGLYLAQLFPGHRLYERAICDVEFGDRPESLLARRSLIGILNSELSINEVFFPAAGACAKA